MTLLANDKPFVVPPDRLDALIDDGPSNATERFYDWIQVVSDRLPLEGSGSPEGSLEANKGRLYINKQGVQGERIYFKTTNGGSTGWEFA